MLKLLSAFLISGVLLSHVAWAKPTDVDSVFPIFKGISEKLKIPGTFTGISAINNPQSIMSKIDKMMGDSIPSTTWYEISYQLKVGNGSIDFKCRGSKVEDPTHKKATVFTLQSCGNSSSVLFSGEWK